MNTIFRDRLSRHQMHITIPAKALAFTRPYAWAIVNAGKPIKNRDWTRKNNLVAELCSLNVTEKPIQGYVALSAWARDLLQ